MKISQIQITQDELDTIELSQITSNEPQLGFIFGSKEIIDKSGVLERLKNETQAIWLGCTTAGEVTPDGVFDNTMTLTAIHFDNPNTKIQVARCNIDGESAEASEEAGRQIANQLNADDLSSTMLLSPGVGVNGSSIINGFQENLKVEIPVTGGLAGDYGAFEITHTLLNGEWGDRQLVGLGFYGDTVSMSHGCEGGWVPFGVDRKVTRAQDNILFELDGEPALEVYKTYLGDQASELPSAGLMFPFSLVDQGGQGNDLIRTILGIDEDKWSLILAGDIPEGKVVRLMHASTEGLVGGAVGAAKNIASSIDQNKTSIALLVSCVGRKLVLGGNIDEEVESASEILGENCYLTGFYSYGEISPFNNGKKGMLHNQTMTIAHISEK